ncbi:MULTISPECIES: sugar ABC transporter ATP-binding protein [unclassified Jeotgalibaca]|uniref:sugar ABC transporter ATP-binding protein n=1 Tax=unclassified Jeotgalibaca TaxID=2621505 RepID=UPI003FD4C24C
MSEKLLEMKNISKSFSGVKALDNVQFDLFSGEVHALMGENGAGKSTLMKILTGVYTRDSGTVVINGQEKVYSSPKEAQDDGVVIVHQELNMMKDLTVAENIFIGRETKTKGLFIDDKDLVNKSKNLFEKLGVAIDPNQRVGELTVGNQQMVEIAKAISMNAKIIVFDEPTAALSNKEIEDLFIIIRDLRKQGIGIVYISHRMDEIGIITDRITIMRDGTYVNTVHTESTSKEDIIRMMVGRTLTEEPKKKSNVDSNAPVVLEVKNLNAGSMVKDISFTLRKGEILGFSGLMGAGRTETARAIFGADRLDSGEIYINGEKVTINNTTDAVNLGIGYISEDRRRYGILTEKSIAHNIALPTLENFQKNKLIDEKKILTETDIYREKLKIKSSSPTQLVKNLSGGNQQKVVIAKWLVRDSDIIILDEPTRGIDIGAKSEIYDLINELVEMGKSIIMISSEMTEILRMSDRVIVLCEGRMTGEVSIEEATQEKILTLATTRNGDENNEQRRIS